MKRTAPSPTLARASTERQLSGGSSALQVVGDRFFAYSNPPQDGPYVQQDDQQASILTASFSSSEPPVRLLDVSFSSPRDPFFWVGTASALYWSDGDAIYSLTLPSSP